MNETACLPGLVGSQVSQPAVAFYLPVVFLPSCCVSILLSDRWVAGLLGGWKPFNQSKHE